MRLQQGAVRLRAALIGAIVAAAVVPYGLTQLGIFGNPGCTWPGAACERVLFIGNSYTSVNDLPKIFASLAWSGGHRLETQALTNGGATLANHVADANTAPTIASKPWNDVVLQDQSENPAVDYYRQSEMYPAAATLVSLVREHNAIPILFLTWGHQQGWPEAGLTSYVSMQDALDYGYHHVATTLGVQLAPVGDAWRTAVSASLDVPLWQSDGVHPTAAGTYLAACVFYATIFKSSPVGLSFHDGLSAADATKLQNIAASTH